MRKVQQQIQDMYRSHPRSLILGMIVKRPQEGKFYTQSHHIERLEVALLEEGRIPVDLVHEFIESLKPEATAKPKPKGNQLF